MVRDQFGRRITYLRISVTDRCNFRCRYCMPAGGVALKPRQDILRYHEIITIAREAIDLGLRKVRLTGGEPLLRRDIEALVAALASLRGAEELCMTTNASLLTSGKARTLRAAGLDRVNISLDTVDPERFRHLTRGGRLDTVLRGIGAAQDNGLTPVKVNMVVTDQTGQGEVAAMHEFCAREGLLLQTINRFFLPRRPRTTGKYDRPASCRTCNRIRLTADGFLRPCLFSDNEIKADMNNVRISLLRAVAAKPLAGHACGNRAMSQIGG